MMALKMVDLRIVGTVNSWDDETVDQMVEKRAEKSEDLGTVKSWDDKTVEQMEEMRAE